MDKQMTVVFVHSPLIQFSSSGSYYTSYAISLKSNNSCFTYSASQIRRRYSEFLHLRSLLASHCPTMKPPVLPPKNYFHRFSNTLIEERKYGLQKFLDEVLDTPVYLSDKSLHLFLQSSCSMSQIDEQCLGDIPAPQLIDAKSFYPDYHCNASSIVSSHSRDRSQSHSHETVKSKSHDTEACKEDFQVSNTEKLLNFPKFRSIHLTGGSLDPSPCSSVSSLDTSYCSSTDSARHVSFKKDVTVVVVHNQMWNIGTVSIRTGP